MLGALILGVSIARTAFGSMAAARMARERTVAHAAAAMALADAEADIGGTAAPSSGRAAWFAGGSGGFVDGCGTGSQDLGLCLPAASPLPPVWQAVDLAADDGTPVVPYGRYTGAVLATGGMLPVRLPGYLIEKLAAAGPAPPPHHLYRITAIGFGTRATTQVVLQAIVRKPAAAAPPGAGQSGQSGQSGQDGQAQPAAPTDPPAPGMPAGTGQPIGRLSWRDIPNWPELHARVHH